MKDYRNVSPEDLPPPPSGARGWPWTLDGVKASPFRDKTSAPSISVVVPSYQQGRFLAATLRSLILQGYPRLEIIVMDGGSTDESVDILHAYAPWLSHWVSEKDKGQSDAINRGFARSSGAIVNWLCSDDTLLPGACFTIAAIFETHPESDVLCGDCIFTDVDGVHEGRLESRYDGYEALIRHWHRGIELPQPSLFLRREVVASLPYFVDNALHYAMDYDFWCRAFQNRNIYITSVALSTYRRHEAAKTWGDAWKVEKLEVSRRFWGPKSKLAYWKRQLDHTLSCFAGRAKQARQSLRTKLSASPQPLALHHALLALINWPGLVFDAGFLRECARALIGNTAFEDLRSRLAQVSVALKVLPLYLKLGRPSRVVYFGGGLGDDLMCTAIFREATKRGQRPGLMLTKCPDLYDGNTDVCGALKPDETLLAGFRHLLGRRFIQPLYHKHVPHFREYAAGNDQFDEPPLHIIAMMCQKAGLTGDIELKPHLTLSERELLQGQLAVNQACIMSNGLPMWRNKNWYPERFQQVADALSDAVTWVQLGAPEDPPIKGAIDKRGANLRDVAAIMAQSRCFVGLEGFLMHLARAVDCPSVIVMGGRSVASKVGYAAFTNLTRSPSCSPCWRVCQCDHDHICLSSITAEEVIEACQKQLANPRSSLPIDRITLD